MKNDLGAARADARRSSGAGIGFLLAYGLTMSVVAALAFLLPVPFVPLSLALMYGAMAIVLRAEIARDARAVGAA